MMHSASLSATEPKFARQLADIDAAWLEQALSQRFPAVRVTGLHQRTLIPGTATKVCYELQYGSGGDTPAAPRSLWLKAGFEVHSAAIAAGYRNEVRFFRELAPQLAINLPDSYYAALDTETGNGLVLLEDLLQRPVRFGSLLEPIGVDAAAAVLELLANLHARYWQKSELKQLDWLSDGGSIIADGVVDQFIAGWDTMQSLPRFARVPEALRNRGRVRQALLTLWERALQRADCLVHGDAHLGNLYFETSGKPGYLDWQTVMRGSWAHDVASFLIPALSIDTRREHEAELLRHYLLALKSAGVEAPSFDTAMQLYAEHAMWTFMWALCPPAYQPEEICTAVTPRACAALSDLQTLSRLGA